MKVITAPEPFVKHGYSIFLAGSIEQDKACHWQNILIESLTETDFCMLNPRRKKWDANWSQSIDNPAFNNQVNWELTALEKADFVVFYFDPKTKSPVTLLELGLYAKSKKIVVCCPEGYWRKGNVDIVCQRYKIPTTDNLQSLIDYLKNIKQMKYNLDQLIKDHQSGKKLKYLFFWGHQPGRDGQITASCLSQWWESDFTVDGILYRSAEHWMMAKKAALFNDQEILEQIIACQSPAEAKKLGRNVRNFNAKVWDQNKFQIVVEGNQHKFSQDENLSDFLANTNTRILVEASPVDSIWGIGMAKDHPRIKDPESWKGENLLGFALMEVRDQIQAD